MIGFEGITKRFPGGGGVSDLGLEVRDDELVALLGPSGCGKTTALRIVAGLVEPERGVVRLGGEDVTALPPERRNVGLVFQNYALFPHLSIADNVAYGLRARGVARAEARGQARQALARVHLDRHAERRPEELSGGEQQRVALARALVIAPRALLLDEPFSNLDAALRRAMREQLKELRKKAGVAALHVTHDQEEALALADRIAVLDAGRLVQLGAPEEVFHRPRCAFVARFLGGANVVRGRIVARSGDGVEVEIAPGVRWSRLPIPEFPGDAVDLALRPEGLELAPPSGSGFAGTISSALYLGTAVEFRVEAFGLSLVVRLPARHALARAREGERVAVLVPPGAAHPMAPEAEA